MDSFLTGESLLFFGKHGRELAVRCNCTLHIFYGLFALMRLLRFNLMACTGVSFTLNKTFNLSLFCFQEELKVRHEPRGGRGEAWVLGAGCWVVVVVSVSGLFFKRFWRLEMGKPNYFTEVLVFVLASIYTKVSMKYSP